MVNLEPDLYTLIAALIGGEALVFSDQNSPRPALPYWTIRVNVHSTVGRDCFGQGVDVNGDQQINGVRQITVQIQRIGVDSVFKVTELRDNLAKTTVLEQWQLKDLALYDKGQVTNIQFEMDGNHLEPRAAMDLFVRFGSRVLDRVGIVETVDITAGYETVDSTPDFDANPDLADTITVVL